MFWMMTTYIAQAGSVPRRPIERQAARVAARVDGERKRREYLWPVAYVVLRSAPVSGSAVPGDREGAENSWYFNADIDPVFRSHAEI